MGAAVPGPRVIVASDKFKGSLTSAEVAAAVGAGVRRVHPGATVVPIPVADGGDGTLAAAVAAGFELVPITASGPTGEPVQTAFAVQGASRGAGHVALVELADVSGLIRLPGGRPAPMSATSYGTGELIAAAIDAGCTRIILGIGGSASTDGGAGLVQALGAVSSSTTIGRHVAHRLPPHQPSTAAQRWLRRPPSTCPHSANGSLGSRSWWRATWTTR